MRTWLIVIVSEVCCSGIVQAQTANCTVSGYLYKPDGSAALRAQVNVISVVKSGPSSVLTPVVLHTDATGFTSFTAPRMSTVWIVASALGLNASGDAAIMIPDADSATLDVLAQSARPPVSGFSLTSGASPTLALSLHGFGINLNAGPTALPTTVESFNGRSGAVTLTSSDVSTALNFTPLDPSTVVGAVNASTSQIDDARLSSRVVLQNIANVFSAPQTLTGIPLTIDKGTADADTQLIVFKSRESGAGDFAIGVNSVANAFSTRRDQVFQWGYNQKPGGRINPAEHSLSYDIETLFTPNSTGEATEAHLVYTNRAGRSFRPMSVFINLNTDAITTDFKADRFSVTTGDGIERLVVASGDLQLPNSTVLRSNTNNVPFVRQKNAAGTKSPALVFLDSADSLVLGDGFVSKLRWAGTGIFVFGGAVVGSPALKANGAKLAVRTGTDSAAASLSALTFQTMSALAALGGGAAPTLGTIGGSGPTVAAQYGWVKMLDSTGDTIWVPAWK